MTKSSVMSFMPFFASGLRFSCVRCSTCCRYESGYVFLSKADFVRLAVECRMDYTSFMQTYCRWVESGDSRGVCLSLKEKSDFDCIFWNGRCTVYTARPVQCRTFPFWQSLISSPEAWEVAGVGCSGINSGALHSYTAIESCLAQEQAARADLVYQDSFITGGVFASARGEL